MFEFFDNRICGSNDELIDFFDYDKNRASFFRSVYCEEMLFSEPFEGDDTKVPYLLLQKIHEINLVRYSLSALYFRLEFRPHLIFWL